jgi:hypothetical protein
MSDDATWDVSQSEGAARVDLTRAVRLSKADTRAILEATEDLLAHDDVTVLELDVPESRRWTREGLIYVFQALDRLAAMHEKRLIVGPI